MVSLKSLLSFLLYSIALVLLVVLRVFGPFYLTFFVWTDFFYKALEAIIVFTVAVMLSNLIVSRIKNVNVRRVANQILFTVSVILALFVFFDVIVSVGLTFGLVGFALTLVFQAPILSFSAWVYITVSKIYSHGDRIRVADFKGDVIDIDLFGTKILEVGGEYVGSDVPSGRVVYFPNSLVLSSAVFNYTKNFSYVWTELPFTVAYESDLQFAKRLITKVVDHYLDKELESIKSSFDKSRDKLAIEKKFHHLTIETRPTSTWVEMRVIFAVDPRRMPEATSEVAERVLAEFKKHPDKIKFPAGRAR